MKKFREGELELYAPDAKIPTKDMEVFYNPEKRACRDISVSFVNAYGWRQKLVVCDLLAGTGVRGLRIATECEPLKVYLNDANPNAYRVMKRNLKLNAGRLRCEVEVSEMNALEFLGTHGSFDYIDVDPFGSPNHFLVAAAKVRVGGVLAVCATDTAALSGTYPRVTGRKYGSKVVMTNFHNEVGLRILIRHVVGYGAALDLALQPVFAHSTRHYFRAYFKVGSGAGKIDKLLDNNRYLMYDVKTLEREVADSGNIGPLWCGPLHDKALVEKMVRVPEHLKDEIETVGYYLVPKVSAKLGKPVPRMERIFEALRQKDVPVSRCHFHPQGLKVEADIGTLKKVLNSLTKQKK